jgi:hypothetical protein
MIQGILIGIAAGIGTYAIGSILKGFVSYSRPKKISELKTREARHEGPARKESEPLPKKAPGDKQWFLIQTKEGAIKTVQALSKTPRTVAGPFPTKQEALNAKERGEAGTSVHVH